MSAITKIEIETWTRNETNASTDDRIDCIITFMDNRYFQQQLDNDNDNFEQGKIDRFTLNLSGSTASAAINGQQEGDIKSIKIKKINGSNMWKCAAVCIRVNSATVLSRYANYDLDSAGSSFTVNLKKNGVLDGLEIKITTGTFGTPNPFNKSTLFPSTDDSIFFGLKFNDSTYEIINLHLYSMIDDFQAGKVYTYLIPLPEDVNFSKYPADIDEITLYKSGADGWFLKGAQLFANGAPDPIISNQNINQFLDDDPEVLNIVSWSSKRIIGPILGYISDTTASIQFRVEREGLYRLEVYLHGTTSPLQPIYQQLIQPSTVFLISSLSPNTHYDFKFFFLLNNQVIPITSCNGSFRTAPSEGSGVRFSFGIGSCCHNGLNPDQTVWNHIKDISLDPSVDIVNTQPVNDLRFFIHTGDTFYFYDTVSHTDMATLSAGEVLSVSRAAHLSARLNGNFQDMAMKVPTCAIWDDHDFRFNDLDGNDFSNKALVKQTFLEYWGNPTPFSNSFGLTTRLSYGNVDIYLMDGRYNRFKFSFMGSSIANMFSSAQCDFIIQDIEARGANKLRILVTGSTWNNTDVGSDEHYGHDSYDTERKIFYSKLNSLISQSKTKGIILISGDIHKNEIYQVKLATNGNVAPEFICSPLGKNVVLTDARTIEGERKWSKQSNESNGYWGFASVHIDTKSDTEPWTVEVRYHRHDNGIIYFTKQYELNNNQFVF